MSTIDRKATAALPTNEPAVADVMREFAFSDLDFRSLSQLAYEHAGIVLPESKRNLVYGRLSRRLRTLELPSFREYREYLAANPRELESFINSLSTNHTKFFRESHHFDHLRSHVAAPFSHASAKAGGRKLRIWSAGCSSGEEPYTIAVVLKKEIHDVARHDVRVLASDIDTDVLAKAARGVYPASSVDEVPAPYRSYFEAKEDGEPVDQVFVNHEVQKLIAFRQLNMLGPWPFKGLFDVIFCRNVMIYFDGPTKSKLVERFTQQVKLGGWLYIGHSESLIGSHPGLELVGRTIYRRVA
jgi:chemotaxis protein methyltransferase CheR